MAYSPTETDLRPPVYDFDLADSEKIRIFAPWKKYNFYNRNNIKQGNKNKENITK